MITPQVALDSFDHIVYGIQLENVVMELLRQVQKTADLLGAHLTFVKISTPERFDEQSDTQFIDQMRAELNVHAGDIAIRKSTSVLQGIEDYCAENQADMMVVSTQERGFWEQWITNPSMTKKLVVKTQVPLLVYHCKKQ